LALKQDTLTNPVTGTGTSGQVSYWSGTNTQAGSNNLFWDAANNRLGVNNATPTKTIDLTGSTNPFIKIGEFSSVNVGLYISDTSTGENTGLVLTGGNNGSTIQLRQSSNSILFGNTGGSARNATIRGDAAAITSRTFTWNGTNNGIGSDSNRMSLFANNILAQIIDSNGNIGIGITSETTSARLHVRGSGTTSATTALLVQNSTPTELFKITDDGAATLNGDFLFTKNSQVNFGTFSNQSISIKTNNIERLFIRNDGGINIRFGGFSFGSDNNIAIFRSNGGTTTVASGSSITFGIAVSDSFAAPKFLFNCYNESKNPTSGESSFLQLQQLLFNPSSGSASFSIINAFSTINQTGGANGITRGLYVNPTLTAAADWRGIESVAASNANHTLLKLRNETVDVFTVKADSKIGFFNATPVVQATTGITESAFVENSGGTAINVDSTFDGYTVQQVVKALKDIGILG
jgi:hypothetical protein